ncbi:ABC transporter ATP-binding protein [Salsipaludibacter albus]|uniref:ABC transporter ATP-binding protein n=1 Tax=Salsipaludibacter albus TaxID=2849650 RepID=UPI0023687B0F|nr:ABC transporter ATP-binding protein [Salsipaludibacter albus]
MTTTDHPGRIPTDGIEAVPGSSKPDPILEVDTMVRQFGGLRAVDVEHLEIQRHWITALIGPNGAGKTTFFNLLTGFDTPNEGAVEFNGEAMPRRISPNKLARQGMVRTFQLTKSLTRLPVIENMKLGVKEQRGERFLPALIKPLWNEQEESIEERADKLLVRFKMDHMRDEFAGTLSGGQRKLLEMARSLMTDPELVMLDEPTAGVNPALTQSLLQHVTGLRDEGMTIIFVEHDMDVVHEIADWVVVMAEGKIIAEGTPDAISKNEAVVDAYLGSHHDSDLTFDDEGDVIRGDEGQPVHDEPDVVHDDEREVAHDDERDVAHDHRADDAHNEDGATT